MPGHLTQPPKLLLCLLLGACSAQQAYYSTHGWQRQQCEKHLNKADYDACLKQANTSYDDYQQQRRQ